MYILSHAFIDDLYLTQSRGRVIMPTVNATVVIHKLHDPETGPPLSLTLHPPSCTHHPVSFAQAVQVPGNHYWIYRL